MQSLVQSTGQKPGNTLYIHIYMGDQPHTFEYYEDDGTTMDYQKGQYFKRSIRFDPAEKKLVFSKREGSYFSGFKSVRCIFHGFESTVNEIAVDDIPVSLQKVSVKLLDGLKYLEGIYDPSFYKEFRNREKQSEQLSVSFQNTEKEITISWK